KYRLTNTRAAMYWRLREALEPETGDNLCLPPDPELLADLTAPRFEGRSSGIVVGAKGKMSARVGRDPDAGDAVALHFAVRAVVWECPSTAPAAPPPAVPPERRFAFRETAWTQERNRSSGARRMFGRDGGGSCGY